jgi:hypothetical protein
MVVRNCYRTRVLVLYIFYTEIAFCRALLLR